MSAKGGLMMGIIGGSSLQPAKENRHIYINKLKICIYKIIQPVLYLLHLSVE